jgi:hypothetical protein
MMMRVKHIIIFLSIGCAFKAHAQTSSQTLSVKFLTPEMQIVPGELLTNVMRIYNPTTDSIEFFLDADFPDQWKQLARIKDSYILGPGELLFLPLRYIPGGNLLGNSRFMISVYLTSTNDQPLGNDMFWAYTQKKVSWSMSSDAGNKIYFKNGTTEIPFNVNILNTGTEQQQIVMTVNNMSIMAEVTDSLGKNKYTEPVNLLLHPYEDTAFNFVFKQTQGDRNDVRIDIENYRPSNLNEERKFNLVVSTEEPSYGQAGAFQTGQRFTFIKLSDDKKADNISYSSLPLVVDYNIANLFDEVSFATLNLRGVALLSSTEQLVYNFQGSVANNQFADLLTDNNYYFGYFGSKGSIQLGYINGGLLGIQSFGQGAKGSYVLNKRNTITAFGVTRKDKFDKEALRSYGFTYDLKYFRQNRARFEIGRSENFITGVTTTAANSRIALSFFKTQSLSFSISNTLSEINNLVYRNISRQGYSTMGNYNGNFFRNRLNITHSGTFNDRNYANAQVERFFYNHRLRILLGETWSFTMANGYSKTKSFQAAVSTVSSFTNQFSLNKSFKNKSIQPTAFYSMFNMPLFSYQMRGMGFNFSTFNPKTNTRFATTIETGVNIPIHILGARNTNFLQWTSLAFYKTFSLNTRYIVGNYGYTPPIAGSKGNQQLFTTSVQHQYLMKNKKIMIQTGFNYFYNNLFKQHSITLFPDIYYFTDAGWRFRLGINFGYISSEALQNNYGTAGGGAEDNPDRITTRNTLIAVGIRKQFAIPIPFKAAKFCDVSFEAFFDVNGNGVKDKNEKAVNNVIIKLGEEEVITNDEGQSFIRNMPAGKTTFTAIPLVNVEGWFANIADTVTVIKNHHVSIPFVKGVKVKGKISIDKEAFNATADEPFDLGRIRVTAAGKRSYSTLTDFNGNFELYLPFGQYVLSVDEGILGSKYKLARNNIEIDVTKESDGMSLSFLIIEKKRKVVKKVFTQPVEQTPVTPQPRRRR